MMNIKKGLELGECPACRKKILGDVVFTVTLPENSTVPGGGGDDAAACTIEATLTAAGCRIEHDCTPKVTRGQGPGRVG